MINSQYTASPSILIKQAKVIDSQSSYHDQIVDILIEKGVITKIDHRISKKTKKTIEKDNLHVSPGWIDIGATCWEPGKEYREDIASLKAAAANGGFTKVFIWPNTDPIIDHKAQYRYFRNQNVSSAVEILPICSITKNCEGTELAEILDLHGAGAHLFSDGLIFKGKDKELYKALEYIKSIDAKILYAPNPFTIFSEGQIHESPISILLGVPGLPSLSEKMDVQKIISLTEYSESSCIIHNISSAEALKECKSNNVVAIGTAYLNLCCEVTDCEGFNTNYKVVPPLRYPSDRKALHKAVETDKITYISSNHYPLENDLKDKEFGLAHFGASGIETTFSGLSTSTTLRLKTIIEKLSYGPATAAGIDLNPIEQQSMANLTLFDPTQKWIYDVNSRKSKSENNPFYGSELVGKVVCVINQGVVTTLI